MQLGDEYPGIIAGYMQTIKDNPALAKVTFTSAEALAKRLRPDAVDNHALFDLLDTPDAAYLRIAPKQVQAAMKAQAKEAKAQAKERTRAERERQKAEKDRAIAAEKAAVQAEKEAEKAAKAQAFAERRQAMEDLMMQQIGGCPTTEREFVEMLWDRNGIKMGFDRVFTDAAGQSLRGEQVLLDMQLTAADCCLVKPRGDLLSVSHIDRAFQEKCLTVRQEALGRVWQTISSPPEITADTLFATLEQVCGFYFDEDPKFASAVLRKIFWQVKRMAGGLEVEQRMMLVLVGQQNSGKTFFLRMLLACIGELAAEASLADTLDTRQIDLLEYLAILLDEMVAADRADCAAIKNFVTGATWSRRPMRSNAVERVKLRATLFGTSNHSLGKLIYDSSGMRRFAELKVKKRAEIEPNWQAIISFPWGDLWRTVDHTADDPLLTDFADVMMQRQEELRNADNCEVWLRSLDMSERRDIGNIKHQCSDYVEWFAADLYDAFRAWEQQYDRGWKGTSLQRWGRDMKSLLDAGMVAGWEHYKYGGDQGKQVYRYTFPASAEMPGDIDELRKVIALNRSGFGARR